MWEGSMDYDFPVTIFDEKGTAEIVLLSQNELVQLLIWKHFVPVKLPEYEYARLFSQVKETRGLLYYNKLIDDSIKIMDVNGNILNTDESLDNYYFPDENGYLVIADFIMRYALDTSYLKYEYENYLREKNFITTFYLASKYLEYAIFAKKEIKHEITAMSKIYFDEAKTILAGDNTDNKAALFQVIPFFETVPLYFLYHLELRFFWPHQSKFWTLLLFHALSLFWQRLHILNILMPSKM